MMASFVTMILRPSTLKICSVTKYLSTVTSPLQTNLKKFFFSTLSFQFVIIISCFMLEDFFTKAIKDVLLALLMVIRFHILTPFQVVTSLSPFHHYYGRNCKTAKLLSKFPKNFK